MNLSNNTVSFIKGLGFVFLTAFLSYVGVAANLPFLSPNVALLVSGAAVWLESFIEGKTGNSLFGAVTKA